MKIEQLDSGSYRIRQQYKGKRYSIVVPYKPTKKEATILMAEKMKLQPEDKKDAPQTFKKCVLEYMENRSADSILSPSTKRGYHSLINSSISESFCNKNIYDITQDDIQKEITNYAKDHAAKTVRNMHGLIYTVLKAYRPNMVINTSLPKVKDRTPTTPTVSEVQQLLEICSGTPFHTMMQLAILGLRSGEMMALTLDDLSLVNGKYMLSITKDRVRNEDDVWVIKDMPKNVTSNRIIEIPKELALEVLDQGAFCLRESGTFLVNLHQFQKKLGIKQTRVHDLRHYCASYLHYLGYPDKYIQKYCGWKTSYTMDKIYKEALDDKYMEMQFEMSSDLLKSGHKNGHRNRKERINTDGIAK